MPETHESSFSGPAPTTAHLYSAAGEDAWHLEFSAQPSLGIKTGVWTTRAGIEQIRDLCNLMLVSNEVES